MQHATKNKWKQCEVIKAMPKEKATSQLEWPPPTIGKEEARGKDTIPSRWKKELMNISKEEKGKNVEEQKGTWFPKWKKETSIKTERESQSVSSGFAMYPNHW